LLYLFRNGVKYTGESHFVYENIQTGKLAVLAFFMKSEENQIEPKKEKDNQHGYATMTQWRRYFDATQILIKENDSIIIDLNLSLLMGENLIDFWRYNGSLTIPPCTEDVTWTVFKEPVHIYNYHFDTFRDDLLFESYRGPQPLYYRKIYRSFQKEILSSIPDQNCCANNKSKANFLFLHNIIIILPFISFLF
jgi:carbonic anhydrase